MNSKVFWRGLQFLAVTLGTLAAFWLLSEKFVGLSLLGASFGGLVFVLGLLFSLFVGMVFVDGMFKEMQLNADLRDKRRVVLDNPDFSIAKPVDKKAEVAKLKGEVEHLARVKKLLQKARLEGKLSERDFNNYEGQRLKRLIDVETRLKELGESAGGEKGAK